MHHFPFSPGATGGQVHTKSSNVLAESVPIYEMFIAVVSHRLNSPDVFRRIGCSLVFRVLEADDQRRGVYSGGYGDDAAVQPENVQLSH